MIERFLVGLVLSVLTLVAVSAHAQVYYPPAVSADVRGGRVVLDASGNATWDVTVGGTLSPFGGVPDVTHFPVAIDNTNPIICNSTSRSTTTVTIHCWRTNLVGLLSGLLGGTLTGAQVDLIARYKAP